MAKDFITQLLNDGASTEAQRSLVRHMIVQTIEANRIFRRVLKQQGRYDENQLMESAQTLVDVQHEYEATGKDELGIQAELIQSFLQVHPEVRTIKDALIARYVEELHFGEPAAEDTIADDIDAMSAEMYEGMPDEELAGLHEWSQANLQRGRAELAGRIVAAFPDIFPEEEMLTKEAGAIHQRETAEKLKKGPEGLFGRRK